MRANRRLQFEQLEPRQMLSAAQPVGPEFQVNTYTTNGQQNPKVASDAAGDYVVVWESYNQNIGVGIFGQRYASTGSALGSEFRISANTTNLQTNPTVAMDANGDFVVAWQSYKYSNFSDENGRNNYVNLYDVYAQRYDASGRADGGNFEVNSKEFGQQFEPSVAMDPKGDFVVAWSGYGDHSVYGIFAQRYNASGMPVGVSNFQVNMYTDAGQFNPAITMDADGEFVVAWSSVNEDGSVEGVYAARFDAIGAPEGFQFQVNTYTTGIQQNPSIASDSAGDFVIAWESGPYNNSGAQDGSGFGVYAQRYASTGSALGSEFQVNTFTAANQLLPVVSMDSDGDFEIAWVSGSFNGGGTATEDGSGYGIYAQQYNATGQPQGNKFRVNTYTTGNQGSLTTGPGIADDLAGDFVVAWASEPQDGSEYGVYAQRYAVPDSATQLAVSMQPPASVMAGSPFSVSVTVEGSDGNPATGFVGNLTVSLLDNPGGSTLAGTTTTLSSGVATFTGLSLNKVGTGYSLLVTASGLTPATTSPIDVAAGAVTQLAISTQPPATVTAATGFGLTAIAEDAEGNVVPSFSGTVTAALANNPGYGVLGGTTTAIANAGVAVLSGLTLDKAGSGYTLKLTSAGLTSATTSSFNVVAGSPTQLVLTSAFPTNVTVGAPFGITAATEDAEGNVASAFNGSVTVALGMNPGGSTLSGTAMVTANAGLAVFTGLSLNNVDAGYTLAVTSSGLTTATAGPFNVTALGVATHLAVFSSSPSTVAPGAPFGVTVAAEDDFGTIDTSFAGNVSLALATNSGASTLAGTTSAAASAGEATFSGLSLNNPGSYTLQATAGNLVAGTTNPFQVVGTLTINGTSTITFVQIVFTDATHFQVILNSGSPISYSTTQANHLIYNAQFETFSEVIFSDPFNTYTALQSFDSTVLTTTNFKFNANGAANLYVYSNGQSAAMVNAQSGSINSFYVGDAALGYSYLGDPTTGVYSELSGFASESVDGATYAYVYSAPHAQFVGAPGESDFTASGFSLTLVAFPQVYAVGSADGSDSMTLESGAGEFVAQPSFSYVSGIANGKSFLVGALYAASVTANGTNPTGQAIFYSYPGDVFNGAQGSSSLTGSAAAFASFSTFVVQATGIRSVIVEESGSGSDVANLTSPGAATFTETPTASTIALAGVTIITVDTFYSTGTSLAAVPYKMKVTGSADGTDTANLDDAPGTNFLLAQGNKATLTSSGSGVSVLQFGKVNAFQANGSSDTVHQQAIDFALQTIGNWTSV